MSKDIEKALPPSHTQRFIKKNNQTIWLFLVSPGEFFGSVLPSLDLVVSHLKLTACQSSLALSS
jgi:hypothetical protein